LLMMLVFEIINNAAFWDLYIYSFDLFLAVSDRTTSSGTTNRKISLEAKISYKLHLTIGIKIN